MIIVGISAVAGIPPHMGCVCFTFHSFSPEFLSRCRKWMLPMDPDRLVAQHRIRPSQVREQFQRPIKQGHAAVGFAFDEKLGRYIVKLYED
jgi:hypothetical protein